MGEALILLDQAGEAIGAARLQFAIDAMTGQTATRPTDDPGEGNH